ncbi:type I 3-dehydroquinate dehydratase [Mogibacterium diversum]
MNTVKIRNIEIGSGIPKICAPIVGATKEDILVEAENIGSLPVDIAEWRVDWFEHVFNFSKVEDVLRDLRTALGETPLLMTFRTSNEGGEKSIKYDDYAELVIRAAETGYVDLVDVEVFIGAYIAKEIIAGAHNAGIKVIGSNHDFNKTPDKDEIVERLRKMQDLGVDIPKIAVMPKDMKDVITLLAATEEMHREFADRPIVTISMSEAGVLSRICGEAFGSAITFGAAKNVSAPGQMEVNDLSAAIILLHEYL